MFESKRFGIGVEMKMSVLYAALSLSSQFVWEGEGAQMDVADWERGTSSKVQMIN